MLVEDETSRQRRARRSPSKPTKTSRQQREQRRKKGRAERRELRQRLVEDDDAVLTFKEWCALNGHSERQGRRIITGGNGPVVTQISERRIGVTRKNNRLWLASRAR